MSDVRCTTCAAWAPTDGNDRAGECRRRSPQPIDPRGITRRVWPTTGWGDWCLDHERRVGPAPGGGSKLDGPAA